MARGGRAWRGWFPVGGELTSGRARPQGRHLLRRRAPGRRRARARRAAAARPEPVPARVRPGCATRCSSTSTRSRRSGQTVMRGIALGLGLDARLVRRATSPPIPSSCSASSTTRRRADRRTRALGCRRAHRLRTAHDPDAGRRPAACRCGRRRAGSTCRPIPTRLVCNVGDMLERMTRGRYRSTPHRARSPGARDRLSFPFFFDPGLGRRGAPDPRRRDRRPPRRRRRAALGRCATCTTLTRHVRRVPADQGVEGLPRPRRRRPARRTRGAP